ncbi:hypothetical protein Chor_013106 [Crotalus horridus]
MKIVLMVAEKPSLAQSIAKILSRGNMSSRKGLNGACSVYEFTGPFIGQTVHFKMTSVCGHVMTLDFIGKYNNWDKVDPAELFSKAPTEKKEANPKLNMVKFLQVEGRGCDYVVLWLDCDKEGENICFEVLDAALPVMNKPRGGEKTVYRAKFSSITDTDICNAMNQLGEPNHNEALSVDARQELDLRIGCAFTSSLISFGPCQTPTLGFCVERHDKIQSFKPETYWVLQVKVVPDKDSCLTLEWDRVRIFDREIAQMFLNLTKMAKEAKVSVVGGVWFTEIMPWQTIPLEESLPSCERGDLFRVNEVKLLEKQTSPPDYLTEAELITLMEKHGIGTDASIPVHINNICQRNYVTVEGGRRLKPTNLGIVLVHGYYKIDAELVLPTIRSAVEKQLNLIAQGKANYHQVLEHTLDIFKRKFHYFVDSIAGMDELMEVSFSPLAATGKPLSRCGKCHRFMKYIQAKPSRLHCSHCDETYSLPQNGTIKLYKELRCPLDDFELVLCCQHSLNLLGIGQCVECESGVLVLDPISGPKWKMACNKCNVVVHFFENAHKVRVSAETCEACDAALVDVDFNKAKSPLPGGETQHAGCVFCDPVFQDLVELKHAAMKHPMHRGGQGKRQGRGRGKGRRLGGRQPPKKPKDKMAALAAYFV